MKKENGKNQLFKIRINRLSSLIDSEKHNSLSAMSFLSFLFLAFLFINSCRKNDFHSIFNDIEQVNLVADTPALKAARIDKNLVNAWGIAVASSGPFWISSNGAGLSVIYDKNGNQLRSPVTIPTPGSATGGKPTGVVFNSTTDFSIPGKTPQPGRFIFATEDGTIAAWGSGNAAVITADRSATHAVYKGLALAKDGAANFLYAANFHEAKIDVFDKDYAFVTGKAFKDPSIPGGFSPFNIRNIGGLLYVTYAKQKGPDNDDDEAGPGNGFVDIYKPDGSLVKRFASGRPLNSPWGIVQAKGTVKAILVGNFGDGRINVFTEDGKFVTALKDEGHTIVIEGLWALENEVPGADPNQLFFTAGPFDEKHGLFGYLITGH
jgi:uncharacterized protein (TIGR03118 family)